MCHNLTANIKIYKICVLELNSRVSVHSSVVHSFYHDTTCWESSPEKFYPLAELAIRTLEEIEIYFSVCDVFCTNEVFVLNFDVQFVLHSATLNNHVLAHWPSWISTAVLTN